VSRVAEKWKKEKPNGNNRKETSDSSTQKQIDSRLAGYPPQNALNRIFEISEGMIAWSGSVW
jgi:hypothetical protein